MGISRELRHLEGGTTKGARALRRLDPTRTDNRDLTHIGEAMEPAREAWRKNRTEGKVVEIPKAPGVEE